MKELEYSPLEAIIQNKKHLLLATLLSLGLGATTFFLYKPGIKVSSIIEIGTISTNQSEDSNNIKKTLISTPRETKESIDTYFITDASIAFESRLKGKTPNITIEAKDDSNLVLLSMITKDTSLAIEFVNTISNNLVEQHKTLLPTLAENIRKQLRSISKEIYNLETQKNEVEREISHLNLELKTSNEIKKLTSAQLLRLNKELNISDSTRKNLSRIKNLDDSGVILGSIIASEHVSSLEEYRANLEIKLAKLNTKNDREIEIQIDFQNKKLSLIENKIKELKKEYASKGGDDIFTDERLLKRAFDGTFTNITPTKIKLSPVISDNTGKPTTSIVTLVIAISTFIIYLISFLILDYVSCFYMNTKQT